MAIERSRELLTADELSSALSDLHGDWSGSPDALTRSIEFADFPTAVEFVNQLAPACEERDHHPFVGHLGHHHENLLLEDVHPCFRFSAPPKELPLLELSLRYPCSLLYQP